jgi:hypothetical protein
MIVSERAVVALIKIEGETQEAIDAAFDDLASRVHWSLPKLRFGDVRVLDKRVQVRRVSIRGVIGKAP